MAGIDKTYVETYEDWKSVMDYARNTKFMCPNGIELSLINYCYYPDKSKTEVENWLNNSSGSIPVMNTSNVVDYFLIKECPLEVIQNRMKEVYDEDFYNSVITGTSEYDTFIRPEGGKHVKLVKKPCWNYTAKWYNDYLSKYRRTGYSIQVFLPEPYYTYCANYNKDFNIWILPNELGEGEGNYIDTDCMSLKSLINKILSWNLPIGTRIVFGGRYVGESGEFIVKK